MTTSYGAGRGAGPGRPGADITLTPWHRGPLCAFATETTRTSNPEIARIVSAAVVLIDGSGTQPADARSWSIAPGGQEPGPALDEIAAALTGAAMADVPVITFDACFDLTVLDRNTRRECLVPFADRFPPFAGVIDPWVLDKHMDPFRKGKRTLTALCEHYGVRVDGAHDAARDATAAARVAWMIAQRYPRIAHMPMGALYDLQVKARAGQAEAFAVWLQSQRKAEIIEAAWPLKPWAEDAAAVAA